MYQTLSDTFVALLLCTPVTWCRMPRKWKKNERTMAGEPNSPRTDGVFDKGGPAEEHSRRLLQRGFQYQQKEFPLVPTFESLASKGEKRVKTSPAEFVKLSSLVSVCMWLFILPLQVPRPRNRRNLPHGQDGEGPSFMDCGKSKIVPHPR